jgi:asparagine synthase (glutamine-hydrolysing)
MCGIAGICNLTRDDAPDESLLRRMLAAIRHRGPDEFGLYLDAVTGLGSARLSIVDLKSGQQPITNEDQTLWIVFNGEIFNHRELRRELESRGHQFRTDSDTEVFLHAFEEHGPDCLHQLNGDFAVAIWNNERRELFVARDRVGVRPLFYTSHGGRLLFASEIKALLAEPGLQAKLDPASLNQIFTYWSTLTPRTAFEDIWELPPGSYALVRDGCIDVRRYWEPIFNPDPTLDNADTDSLADELAALQVSATQLRLRADVPVGAYLSGGLDSSTIAAIVRHETGTPLETFSIAFADERFDESPHQQRMANMLGTQHHIVRATHSDIGRAFGEVIRHTETPVLRTAPAPMFLLSQLVHEHRFKVVLTGEGADEFFGGYDIFKEAKIRAWWAKQPNSTRRRELLRRLYPDIPGVARVSTESLAAFFGEGLSETASPFYSHAIRWRNTARAKRFLNPDLIAAREPEPGTLPVDFAEWDTLSRAQFLESTIFLPQYLLSSQGDRPAMAHSVEGRFPFLDHRVIEFALHLPPKLKLRGLMEKYLLRKAASRWLPREIAMRRKQPYRAPIHRSFFGNGAPGYVGELLAPEAISRAGYFKPGAVTALANKLQRGQAIGETDDMALAGILSTQLLHEQFIARRADAGTLRADDDVKICRAPQFRKAA